jgi:hypothetical protein
MPKWSPAERQAPVAMHLQQSIMIEAQPVVAEPEEE